MPYGYYAQTNIERRALGVATMAHNGQMRKCAKSTPYIVHPVNVALLLQQAGESTYTIAGGLLHDVLEKAYLKYDIGRMRREFGHDITNMVRLVTKDLSITDWYECNELYLATIYTTRNIGAQAIVAADKSSNLADILTDYETLGEPMWDLFNSDKNDQLWWYSSVHEVLSSPNHIPNHPLVKRLGEQVIKLEEIVQNSAAA